MNVPWKVPRLYTSRKCSFIALIPKDCGRRSHDTTKKNNIALLFLIVARRGKSCDKEPQHRTRAEETLVMGKRNQAHRLFCSTLNRWRTTELSLCVQLSPLFVRTRGEVFSKLQISVPPDFTATSWSDVSVTVAYWRQPQETKLTLLEGNVVCDLFVLMLHIRALNHKVPLL